VLVIIDAIAEEKRQTLAARREVRADRTRGSGTAADDRHPGM